MVGSILMQWQDDSCCMHLLFLCALLLTWDRGVNKSRKWLSTVAFLGRTTWERGWMCSCLFSLMSCYICWTDSKNVVFCWVLIMKWLVCKLLAGSLSCHSGPPNTDVLRWSLHSFSGLDLSSFEFEDWFISYPMEYGKESGKSKMLAMQLTWHQRAREGETNRKQKQQEHLKQLLEVVCSLIILKQSNSFSPKSVFFCLVACAFLVLGFVMVITWVLLFIGRNMFVCFSQHLNLAQARLLLSLHEPPPNQVPSMELLCSGILVP